MNTQKVIFYGMVFVFIILCLFNVRVNSLKVKMQMACTGNYSSYVKTKTCPCQSPKPVVQSYSVPILNLNFSNMDVGK